MGFLTKTRNSRVSYSCDEATAERLLPGFSEALKKLFTSNVIPKTFSTYLQKCQTTNLTSYETVLLDVARKQDSQTKPGQPLLLEGNAHEGPLFQFMSRLLKVNEILFAEDADTVKQTASKQHIGAIVTELKSLSYQREQTQYATPVTREAAGAARY